MRTALLVILSLVLLTPTLSGCFCPYGHGWHGRGDGYERGHRGDRGYDYRR